MHLELLLYHRAQNRPFVDIGIIVTVVTFAIQQQRGLVNAIDDTVAEDELGRLAQSHESGEQVGDMDNIAHRTSRFNHARPSNKCVGPDAAFQVFSLAAAIDQLAQAGRT